MSAETRYEDALRNLPPPGNGCHTALMSVATLGAMCGYNAEKIRMDIKANLKPGNRKVPEDEITKTIRNALSKTVPVAKNDNIKEFYDYDESLPDTQIKIVDPRFVGNAPLPSNRNSAENQTIEYLKALFHSDEKFSYCFRGIQREDGHYSPATRGSTESVGKAATELRKHDIGYVLGDYDTDIGGWIRINPVKDDQGTDSSISAYRHALVESDNLPTEKQWALIQELRLPCAAVVSSGGKSIHAIVRVDAKDKAEYQSRVNDLLRICEKNGLKPDKQTVNPSRYSRFPGLKRGDQEQTVLATNIGEPTWEAWLDYIASKNDDLPEITDFDGTAARPALSPEVIKGVLRRRHKLLLSGPSKAGKSFLLLELALALAQGREWIGWQCEKCRVLYVNLELDGASCLNRIYDLLHGGTLPKGVLDVWNLRGHAIPLSELAPRLIRRAKEKGYGCIIVDPIYKVITGDENSAAEMARFCNFFDQIADRLGCSMVYCHHHSKGEQGQKRAQDRASGSGVFARDPDAMLDMIELEISADRRRQLTNRLVCEAIGKALDQAEPTWRGLIPQDDMVVGAKLAEWAASVLGSKAQELSDVAILQAECATAWRIEGILREFPGFQPRRMWYLWPHHVMDDGLLADALAPGEEPPRKPKKAQKDTSDTAIAETKLAYDTLKEKGEVTIEAMADELGVTNKGTLKVRISRAGLHVRKGVVYED